MRGFLSALMFMSACLALPAFADKPDTPTFDTIAGHTRTGFVYCGHYRDGVGWQDRQIAGLPGDLERDQHKLATTVGELTVTHGVRVMSLPTTQKGEELARLRIATQVKMLGLYRSGSTTDTHVVWAKIELPMYAIAKHARYTARLDVRSHPLRE